MVDTTKNQDNETNQPLEMHTTQPPVVETINPPEMDTSKPSDIASIDPVLKDSTYANEVEANVKMEESERCFHTNTEAGIANFSASLMLSQTVQNMCAVFDQNELFKKEPTFSGQRTFESQDLGHSMDQTRKYKTETNSLQIVYDVEDTDSDKDDDIEDISDKDDDYEEITVSDDEIVTSNYKFEEKSDDDIDNIPQEIDNNANMNDQEENDDDKDKQGSEDTTNNECMEANYLRIPCDACEHVSSNIDGFRAHKSERCKYKRNKLCMCPFPNCIFKSNNLYSLCDHIGRKHTKEKRFSCESCSRTYVSKFQLSFHREKHNDPSKFYCDRCEHFVSVERYEKHINMHSLMETGKECLQCKVCSKRYSRTDRLNHHMKIHTGESIYKCVICEKQFGRKDHLDKHMNTHTGDSSFKCLLCEKEFGRKDHLDKHTIMHTCESRVKCTVCNKTFGRKDHLNRHMKMHYTASSFECTICKKGFVRKDHLTKHMVRHTDNYRFTCVHCEKKFHFKTELKTHTSRMHAECRQIL